jgi:ubiquitin-conjugating enzyme E2 M
MQGERRPFYVQRINRDIAELFSHNFLCSSSNLTVVENISKLSNDQLAENSNRNLSSSSVIVKSLSLNIAIFEGPYRGGRYIFTLSIPEGYPFKGADVSARQPIWHPNIDLQSGRVALPLDWSPVLSLTSLALAVQVIYTL